MLVAVESWRQRRRSFARRLIVAKMARKNSEMPLKALVFADTCDNSSSTLFAAEKFLHSKPVLAWQLSTLARFGVKEAIVLSSNPIEVPYSDPLQRMKITKVSSPGWHGEGDALRDIDGRSDIRPQDDFLIVRSGAVFNMDVMRLVKEHKERRVKDRNWLLTSVFRRGTAGAPSGLVIAVESGSGTLIKFDERCTSGVSLDVKASNAGLENGGSVEICSDVVDVGLDVCAPDLLVEFKDNFDFDRVRALTREKLESGDAETLGNRMYAHFTNSARGEYASRIDTLAALAQTTADVFNGWMHPVSLGTVAAPHQVHHFEPDVFFCPSVEPGCATKLSAQAYVAKQWSGRNSVIGRNASIGEGARIWNSVIGDGVAIGKGAVIDNSIVCNNSTVEPNAVIDQCVLSEKSVVRKGSKLPSNCFLDSGVVIGPDFCALKAGSMVSTQPDSVFCPEGDFDGDHEEDAVDSLANEVAAWQLEEVGHGGVGRLVSAGLSGKDPFFAVGVPSSILGEDVSDEEDELEERANGDADMFDGENGVPVNGTQARDANQLLTYLDADMVEFHREICELFERDRVEHIALDNTILEANSLRLSYDLTFPEMLAGVIIGIARSTMTDYRSRNDSNVYAGFVHAFRKYAPVTTKYTQLSKAHDFETVSILSLTFASEGATLSPLLKVLYEADVVDEEGILLWAEKEQAAVTSREKNTSPIEQCRAVVEWLQADSDSE